MIAWPALLHYAGQAELEYVADAYHWQRLSHGHHLRFHRDDRVIDSEGKCYRPVRHSDHVELLTMATHVTLTEAIALVRHHEAAGGQCCVAKFSAASIADCVAALKDIS